MTEPLFLESLMIGQFRAFSSLNIERLGRVNLIVGKNNVGKSSLLEALWLYAHQGHPEIVWKILQARDEGHGPARMPQLRLGSTIEEEGEDFAESVRQLFHRDAKNNQAYFATIGPIGAGDRTLIIVLGVERDAKTGAAAPMLGIKIGQRKDSYKLEVGSYRLQEGVGERCVMVAANGLAAKTVEQFWDKVALTRLEDDVLSALRLIAKDIERVNLLAGRKHRVGRIPVVKIADVNDPIPLRSLGEGMNRMFGIALALVNAKDGILLMDEIESGLHYSVQPEVWQLVFEVARRLNIQVFATTHSWDCLTAFQEAAKAYEQDEGVLIRLVEKKGQIAADLFDEDDLGVAAREGIEVR